MIDVLGESAAHDQAGLLSRRQVLAAGGSDEQIRARLRSGRWRSPWPGVYVTFTGPLPPQARLWAALLRAGDGAVAGPWATLWLVGLLDRLPEPVDVLVPQQRRVRAGGPLRVTRRRRLDHVRHPAASPPRLVVEEAVLDAAAEVTRDGDAISLVLRAVQRRRTTAGRLREALADRPRHPRRRLLGELLADVTPGVVSALELRWLRSVERAHGLPAAARNRADRDGRRRRYRDLEYPGWLLVIELDGREAHPDGERFRDRTRDNRVTVSGRRSLRYGWSEVADDPCGIAAEVAAVLRSSGWTGRPHPCGHTCLIH